MEKILIDEIERIDIIISKKLQIPRNFAQKLIKEGNVEMSGKKVYKASYKGKLQEELIVKIPAPPELIEGRDIPLKVVFEDEFIIVIDKPAGLITHGGPGIKSPTLVEALVFRGTELPTSGRPYRPGIVHRLDKDTSGLIVVAKKDQTYHKLVEMIKKREVKRNYLALVKGITPPKGVIDLPLDRDNKTKTTMTISFGGREAITYFDTLQHIGEYSLLKLTLDTGRTHQIRVHLKHSGFPVYGDPIYGVASKILSRQFLHAFRLSFNHPETGKNYVFISPLSLDLQETLKIIRKVIL